MWRRGIIRLSPVVRRNYDKHFLDGGDNIYDDEPKKKFPEWRKPWKEQNRGIVSMLQSIKANHKPNEEILEIFAGSEKPIRRLLNLWKGMEMRRIGHSQEYRRDRVESLGVDLAAAFFVIYRGGKVSFHKRSGWVKIDDPSTTKPPLPNIYTEGYIIEKIDCENFLQNTFHYEGLENFKDLEHVRWLSFRGNHLIDDWCVDKIVSMLHRSLEYLDLGGCSITDRGLIALYKMEILKTLVLNKDQMTQEVELVCSMLEDNNENFLLKVRD